MKCPKCGHKLTLVWPDIFGKAWYCDHDDIEFDDADIEDDEPEVKRPQERPENGY